MKIYTGTGDKGKTGLFSGERLQKCDPRIDAYGEIDELNAAIGAVKAACEVVDQNLDLDINRIQSWLMTVGAWLATTPGSAAAKSLEPFTEEPVIYLESAMDKLSEALPELKQFILPQGHLSAAMAHVARTVCRRAERRLIHFSREDTHRQPVTQVMANILVFMNRLSDYLFVLSRHLNQLHGRNDTLWKP